MVGPQLEGYQAMICVKGIHCIHELLNCLAYIDYK